ncbi:5-formyltetrahydrofolate cyclo-ligase [Candidatus Nitrosocosmicus arcticus]|uniref:Putative 5-formyltetrahydrofolate cyclo-ligase n=1 Tax=Candidatus Nitrosocosmicus arcticus TaxID=2035267 RepID=A0A557SX78_9ARCH|nr:5-formyltetrahydrofolate cyclo-ligase [Candidatus Nitrosocosmicus arcticus]TVP41204.1 putative 5-formyltetrahydrofolate cyclo-ligase [Candidatus Nitrosocosmicus arcticus]
MVLSKEVLRKKYLLIRKNLPSYDCFIKSWSAQQRFLGSRFFTESKVIGLYYPILNEIQTFRIISKAISNSKTVCLPTIIDERIVFFKYDPTKRLRFGKYGIMEPEVTSENMNSCLDTVITPGIVFDMIGNRIGYGKGYYDKFFNSNTFQNRTLVGLGYDFQIILEKITCEAQDVKMNTVISDKRLLHLG